MKLISSILLILGLFGSLSAQTPTFVVTNINNSGTGSLRQAVINAMATSASATTITFNLPTGNNIITLSTEILVNPTTTTSKSLTINGYTSSNPNSKVIVRGTGTRSINGLRNTNTTLTSLTIYGLQFENFLYAVASNTNTVIGAVGNNANVFVNNNRAIYLSANASIVGNYIGTDKNFTTGLGNTTGIESAINASQLTISNNYICKNTYGILVHTPGTSVKILNNIIGTNNTTATRTDLGNASAYFGYDASGNTSSAYFDGNTIAYTSSICLSVDRYEIRDNNFICNSGTFINNHTTPYPTPVVSSITPNQYGGVNLSGTSNAANDSIYIFQKDPNLCSNTPCQGTYIGSTVSNGSKQWSAYVTVAPGKQITVVATVTGTQINLGNQSIYAVGTSSQLTGCYTIPCPTVNVSLQTTRNVSCYGGNEGAAQLTVTPNGYTYFSFNYSLINATTNATVSTGTIFTTPITIANLAAGTYRVVTTNPINGCSYTSSNITITQPNAPLSTTTCRELTPVTTPTSNDAVGQVVVSGGTPPYSLTVTRPTGTSFTLGPQTSGTFNISNLAPGNYSVTATDANFTSRSPSAGCTANCTFTINTPTCKALRVGVVSTTNVLCNGGSTGGLIVKYADLVINFPLTLTASNGFSQTITAFSSDSTVFIPNLTAGNYTITLRNRLNCQVTTNASITQPAALIVRCDTIIHAKRVGEASGSAKVSLLGGMAGYTLFISGATNRTYNSTSPAQINIDTLKKGNYIATVEDFNDCRDTCQFAILEPDCTGYDVIATTTPIRCFGEQNGRIVLTTTNGSNPLTYTWSNNTIGNQPIADNLNIGTYKATVTDDRNCKDSITTTITTPSVLTTLVNKTDVSIVGAANGRIVLSVSGGTPNYQVSLSLGTQDIPVSTQTSTTFTFTNLAKGTYIAATTDARGCTKTDTIRINDPNCNFAITAQTDSVSCFGGNNGRITISHNNTTSGVTYNWSQTGIGNLPTATGLRAGIYSVTATTTQNCSDTLSIEVFEPDSLAVSYFPYDVTILGGSNGHIDITVSGGTQPYSVMRGTIAATRLNPTSFVFNNLPKGTYTFTVTDAKGCSTSRTVTINEPVCNMTLDNQTDSVSCKGTATGRINIVVNNSLGSLSYAWTPPSVGNTNLATNLVAGTYSVTVTDSRRCSASTTIRVFEPNTLTSTYSVVNVSTINGHDGRINIAVQGGTKPYIVRNDTSTASILTDSTFVFNNLTSGTYTFTVTDARGCTSSQTVTVGSPNCNMTAQINITQAISCFGASDGRINVVVQNAQTPQYNWLPNIGNTASPNNLSAGNYAVTVTDTRGCMATAQINLTQPAQITASMVGDTSICAGQAVKLRFNVQNATIFSLSYTNGVDTFRQTTLETTITPSITTTYRLLSIQSSTCSGLISSNNRATITVTTPSVPTGLKAEKDSLCSGLSIRLSVNALNTTQYIWQTPLGEVTTIVPQLIIQSATVANSGNYSVKTMQNTCLSAATTAIVVRVFNVPTEKANAGVDKIECDQTISTLSATAIANQGITGRWTALNGGVLAIPTSNVTSISNLSVGINRFIWILTSPVCGEVSRDTVAVSVSTKPVLAATQQVNLDSKLTSALINTRELLKDKSIDASQFVIKVLKSPDKARVLIQNNGIYFDRNDLIDAQTVEIEFEICSKICPTLCSKGKMVIVLQALVDDTDFSVPKVFSINNRNGSSLEINGLDFFLDNEITIVNRWGAIVFGPTSYQKNSPEKAWDGKKDGKALPTGAYYYFIRYNVLKVKKGIIYLVEEL